MEILDGWVSDSYGVKQKAPVVNYPKISKSPTFCNIIYPNMYHGWRDADTGQIYPVLHDALNWLDEKFGD